MSDELKVFVSWSGEPSRRCALLLRDMLPDFNHLIKPFVSSEDIAKGERGLGRITAQLEGSRFGIVCVTPGNRYAPWINYEAGALSHEAGQQRVAPLLLLGATVGDLANTPLYQFQATSADVPGEVLKLIQSINSLCTAPVEEKRLADRFRLYWPELERGLKEIARDTQETERSSAPPRPSSDAIQDQMLSLLRQQVDRISALEQTLSALHANRPVERRNILSLFDEAFLASAPSDASRLRNLAPDQYGDPDNPTPPRRNPAEEE